jgi:predicted DNA-binding transcriptional regulator YafY
MNENETKRLSRLTAILTQLQVKRLVTATTLAEKFSVSVRTIYRDIRALEQSGVPIITEEGKGYSIMDGYKISPVMFTENEANALISAGIIIEASNDESLIKEFSSAIQKIKAVIPNRLQERTEALEAKFAVAKTYTQTSKKSKYLLSIQKALIEHWIIKIEYTNLENINSVRELEPFAIYSNENDEWILIAHCRLRNEFRSFLLNRIQNLIILNIKFEPHPITLTEYRKKVYGD